MIAFRTQNTPRGWSFRTKLALTMMAVVIVVALPAHYYMQGKLAAAFQENADRTFQAELNTLGRLRNMRQEALLERGRRLVEKPHMQAALRTQDPGILYADARTELADLLAHDDASTPPATAAALARFYRFLRADGTVMPAPAGMELGQLTAEQEAQLGLPGMGSKPQIGYLEIKDAKSGDALLEVLTVPIVSPHTQKPVGALSAGFTPMEFGQHCKRSVLAAGIYFDSRLHLDTVPEAARAALEKEIARNLAAHSGAEHSFTVAINGTPHRLSRRSLNPGSQLRPAHEVCIYPLGLLLAQQKRVRWQIWGATGGLILLGFAVSHLVARRLSRPVEKLAEDSAENCALRERAEAALGQTSEELQRTTRFSADASHQLKTPVTVLRAGLEELLARPPLTAEQAAAEVSVLIHQTHRLSNIVEDLLLLSRMEAGRLRLEISSVDLKELIDGWLDDLSVLPNPLGLEIESVVPTAVFVEGERRYTSLILQNLLENSRKYNRAGGRIRLSVTVDDTSAVLTIGNTGQTVVPEMREHIFERFHRGTSAENIPGHGLGLNLARELARLHRGDLRLLTSEDDWTQFEVRFRLAPPPVGPLHERAHSSPVANGAQKLA